MSFWNILKKGAKTRNVTAPILKDSYKNLPFKNDYNHLIRQYDLRMWYISNSPHDQKCMDYVNDLE